MNDYIDKLHKSIEDLKRHGDEIRVQMHLAKAELKDEWKKAEEKLEELQTKFNALKKDTRESSKEVGNALGILADETATAFKKIKQRLKEKR